MSEFLEMLMEQAHSESQNDRKGKLEPLQGTQLEAALQDLREMQRLYARENPFKVGDLITPKDGQHYSGAGYPHLVVEVFDPPQQRPFGGDISGTSAEGAWLDLRVATVNPRTNNRVMYVVESWGFESWSED